MEEKNSSKITSADLIRKIGSQKPGAKSPITGFLIDHQTGFPEVHTMCVILKRKGRAAHELLETVPHHPGLKALKKEDLIPFYHGCAQSVVTASLLKTIYSALSEPWTNEIPKEAQMHISFLYKAQPMKMEYALFQEKVVIAFTKTKRRDYFEERAMNILKKKELAHIEGRLDALKTVCHKIKAGHPVDDLAYYLLGVSFQTKWIPVQFTEEIAQKALVDFKRILNDMYQMKDSPVYAIKYILNNNLERILGAYKS